MHAIQEIKLAGERGANDRDGLERYLISQGHQEAAQGRLAELAMYWTLELRHGYQHRLGIATGESERRAVPRSKSKFQQ